MSESWCKVTVSPVSASKRRLRTRRVLRREGRWSRRPGRTARWRPQVRNRRYPRRGAACRRRSGPGECGGRPGGASGRQGPPEGPTPFFAVLKYGLFAFSGLTGGVRVGTARLARVFVSPADLERRQSAYFCPECLRPLIGWFPLVSCNYASS